MLLYVHGSGQTHDSFAAQVAAFEGSDAVSLPGHPEGRALQSVGDCATWLQKYIRWKGEGQAIVAGSSLGGAIALDWALRYPTEAAGLILIGTGARLRVSAEIFSLIDRDWPGCIDTFAGYELGPGATDALRERFRSWHLQVGRESTRQDFENCNGFDIMDRLHALTGIPALIIVGAEDRMTPVKYSTFLHERIPNSDLLIVEGAGHLVHAEAPDRVNDAIARMVSAQRS